MPSKTTRRQFVCRVVPASAVAAAGCSLEERTLRAQQEKPKPGPAPTPKAPQAGKDALPTGKIGKLTISRLIIGGNLIAGFAHARDLMYVSQLMKNYFTDEKVFETLQLAEAHGINTVNTNPSCTKVIRRYREERGGKIQWIVQGYPTASGNLDGLKKTIDDGAQAIYVQGNIADRMVRRGKLDVIAKSLELIRASGLPAGVGGHDLAVPRTCEREKFPVDFYVKTLHAQNYFSAQRPSQKGTPVVENRADNYWCVNPEETMAFMKTVEKPWIAYKVMAAGAINPKRAFAYAFDGGADFVLAGIFDFQVGYDVQYAKDALAKVERTRPWRA
jgi:hypothetical protein